MYVEQVAEVLEKYGYKGYASIMRSFKEELRNMRFPCAINANGVLRISPRHFNKLNLKQKTFALMHELCHFIFSHFRYTAQGRNMLMSNIACDTAINYHLLDGHLISRNLLQKIDGGVYPSIVFDNMRIADDVFNKYYDRTSGYRDWLINSDVTYKYLEEVSKQEDLMKNLKNKFTKKEENRPQEDDDEEQDDSEDEFDEDNSSDEDDSEGDCDEDSSGDYDEDEEQDDNEQNDSDDEDDSEDDSDEDSSFDDEQEDDSEQDEESEFDDSEDNEEDDSEQDGEQDEEQDESDDESDEDENDDNGQDDSEQGDENSSDDLDDSDDSDEEQEEDDSDGDFDDGESMLPGQEYENGFEEDENTKDQVNALIRSNEDVRNAVGALLNEMGTLAVASRDGKMLSNIFEQYDKVAPINQVNWQKLATQAMYQANSRTKEYSFARPNRRNLGIQRASNSRVQLPNNVSRPNSVPNCHVYVDTSGSISDQNLVKMLYEVSQIFKFCSNFNLEVIPFNEFLGDPCVSKAGAKFDVSKFNFQRGGTAYSPIWARYFEKGVAEPDVCIIITDGEPEKDNYYSIDWSMGGKMIGKRTIFVTDMKGFKAPNPKMEVIYRQF